MIARTFTFTTWTALALLATCLAHPVRAADSTHSVSHSPLLVDDGAVDYDISDIAQANEKLEEFDFKKKFSEFGNLDIFIIPKPTYNDLIIVKFNDEPRITLEQIGQIHDFAFRFLNEARLARQKAEREQAKQNASEPTEALTAFRVQNLEGQAGETFFLVNTSAKTHTINSMLMWLDSPDQVPAFPNIWWEHGSPLKPRESVIIARSEKLIQGDVSLAIGTVDDYFKSVKIGLVKTNFPILKIENGGRESQAKQSATAPKPLVVLSDVIEIPSTPRIGTSQPPPARRTDLAIGDQLISNDTRSTIVSLPPALVGAEWIQMSSCPWTFYATFKLTAEADAYFAFSEDLKLQPIPSHWIATGEKIKTAIGSYDLYRIPLPVNKKIMLRGGLQEDDDSPPCPDAVIFKPRPTAKKGAG